MPRRALLILALLVIAVSVAWLVWPVSPSESKQRRTDGVESAADSHGAGPTAPGVAETVNREQMAAASSEDVDAVPEFAPHSTASNALTVEVFDITTGQPAAGAELFYLDRGHWDSELRNTVYAEEKSTTGQAIRYGIRYRCDENGTARISPRTGSAAIAARLPGLRGAIEVRNEPTELAESYRIDLQAERSLTVRVTRADGSPAAECQVATAHLQGRGQWIQDRMLFTDLEGLARFDYLEGRQMMRGGLRPHVVIAEPLQQPVRLELERTRWPDGIVELQLPETGAIEVQLVTGEALYSEPDAWIAMVCRAELGQPIEGFGWHIFRLGSGGQRKSDTNGKLLFPYVSPGSELDLQISRSGEFASHQVPCDVSAIAGRTVGTLAQMGPLMASVSARVLDPQGVPLADIPVVTSLVDAESGSRLTGTWLKTDQAGRVELAVEQPAASLGRHRLLEVVDRRENRAVVRRHTIPVPDLLESGPNDLGDLTLGGRDVVAGTVLSPDGDPIPEAWITLQSGTPDDYSRIAGLRTLADGRFRFDCEVPQSKRFLHVQPGRPYLDQDVEFTHGNQDLQIVVQRDTSLTGRLLLAPGVPYTLFRIEARAVDDSWNGYALHREQDTAFEITSIPAGKEIEVTVHSHLASLLVYSGRVLLQNGEQAAPPELNPLDLTEDLHYHRLEILRDDGSMPPSCAVEILLPDGTRKYSGIQGSNLFETLSEHAELEVLAKAPGCIPQLVTLRGSGEIRLSPGLRGVLDLEIPELPQGSVFVLFLSGSHDIGLERAAIVREQFVFTEAGRKEILLPVTSNYSVTGRLEPSHRMGYQHSVTIPPDMQRFDFRSPGERYFLSLPADAFTKALGENED